MTSTDWDHEFGERAGVFEHDASMPRDIAEAWARAEVTEKYGARPTTIETKETR